MFTQNKLTDLTNLGLSITEYYMMPRSPDATKPELQTLAQRLAEGMHNERLRVAEGSKEAEKLETLQTRYEKYIPGYAEAYHQLPDKLL
jgi:hypothetical protein